LNKQKRRKSNEDLKYKDYKWGFDGNEFFIGFKLAFAMDYKTKRPLLFLIYPANTSDCQIFEDVLENLKKKGLLRPKTIVMADKGFCSYYNYNVALKKSRSSNLAEGEHEYEQTFKHDLNSSNLFS